MPLICGEEAYLATRGVELLSKELLLNLKALIEVKGRKASLEGPSDPQDLWKRLLVRHRHLEHAASVPGSAGCDSGGSRDSGAPHP